MQALLGSSQRDHDRTKGGRNPCFTHPQPLPRGELKNARSPPGIAEGNLFQNEACTSILFSNRYLLIIYTSDESFSITYSQLPQGPGVVYNLFI